MAGEFKEELENNSINLDDLVSKFAKSFGSTSSLTDFGRSWRAKGHLPCLEMKNQINPLKPCLKRRKSLYLDPEAREGQYMWNMARKGKFMRNLREKSKSFFSDIDIFSINSRSKG